MAHVGDLAHLADQAQAAFAASGEIPLRFARGHTGGLHAVGVPHQSLFSEFAEQ
jgi:hypothetical protein